jgi:hypothetical protein
MIDLAVITGAKAHDVIGFHKLFQGLDGISGYIQHIDDFASSPEDVRDHYDAFLFFFMMKEGPTDEGIPGYCGKPKSAIERLGQTGQGIIVLHHALLAYPEWPVWSDMVGIQDRSLSEYRHDEKITIKIADNTHPITQGLSDWIMVDETYLMANAEDPCKVLLQTDHHQSMETIAWVNQYKTNRVFCLQSGHDHQTWEDENFKTVLKRGIEWSCGQG